MQSRQSVPTDIAGGLEWVPINRTISVISAQDKPFRILRFPRINHLVMQVRPRRFARIANFPDDIPAFDPLSLPDQDM